MRSVVFLACSISFLFLVLPFLLAFVVRKMRFDASFGYFTMIKYNNGKELRWARGIGCRY